MSLSRSEAEGLIEILKQKELSLGRAPNTWYTFHNHVFGAAQVAQILSEKIDGMNPNEMYVLALLHDISRTEEDREQRFHGILGYEKLKDIDEKAARSALSHMFVFHQLPDYTLCAPMFYHKKEDYDFVADFLSNTHLSDEDLLIQLADTLSNKYGFVTIEQRLNEYAKRHPTADLQPIYEKAVRLKNYFDDRIGEDVYKVLHISV